MSPERRNDVGMKLGLIILTAVISLMLTTFLTATMNEAKAAREKAQTNETKIERNIECLANLKSQINKMSMVQEKMDDKIDVILRKVQ